MTGMSLKVIRGGCTAVFVAGVAGMIVSSINGNNNAGAYNGNGNTGYGNGNYNGGSFNGNGNFGNHNGNFNGNP